MSVLALPVAKAHLNITRTDHDLDLQASVDAAEAVIARLCGPLEPTPTTARVDGGPVLLLTVTPAISLTSVTPVDGAALTLADLYLDGTAGVVSYTLGGTFGSPAYTVVYSAGRATCPDDLLMAVKELVRHLWQSQRGPTRRPGSPPSGGVANTVPGAAHTLPFRVTELIGPHLQPGFA
jgi:hypothetical protein